MNRFTTLVLTAAFMTAGAAQAQTLKDHIAESKGVWSGVRDSFIRQAEAMPDDNYSFKAASDTRNFGEVIAHIADTEAGMCSAVSGNAKKVDAAVLNLNSLVQIARNKPKAS